MTIAAIAADGTRYRFPDAGALLLWMRGERPQGVVRILNGDLRPPVCVGGVGGPLPQPAPPTEPVRVQRPTPGDAPGATAHKHLRVPRTGPATPAA